jgi:hypothetical protein
MVHVVHMKSRPARVKRDKRSTPLGLLSTGPVCLDHLDHAANHLKYIENGGPYCCFINWTTMDHMDRLTIGTETGAIA